MANPYYNQSGNPGTGAVGASASIRAEFASIAAAFSLLPPVLAGNGGALVVVNAGGTGLTTTTTPALGTPANITLTYATGLPISTGLTGAGTGVLAALAQHINTSAGFVTGNGATLSYLSLSGGTLSGPLTVDGPVFAAVPNSTTVPAYVAQTSAIAVPFVQFWYLSNLNIIGSITTNALGTGTLYNTTSDARLKIDDGAISPESSGRIIDGLRPSWFRWKARADADWEPGFFAQQVHKVFPWAVTKGRGKPGSKKFQPWQMDAAKLMPVVIAELQALRARVAELEAR